MSNKIIVNPSANKIIVHRSVNMVDRAKDMINKAGHVLYDNINNIEWKHLPKPISDYYDEIMRYYYLGDELYLFKLTGIDVSWSEYFIAKGDSPWHALKNHFKWNVEEYHNARHRIKPLTRE